MARNLHLTRALADLSGRMGVRIADLTADEMADIVHAADRCADPFREVNADAAGMPVRVCEGVHFWKLTIGASVWLDQYASPILGGRSPRYKMALVHALVHAREPDAFEGLDTEARILRACRRTARRISATPAEVNAALDVVLGLAPDLRQKDVSDAAADWCALCARLETQTGIPAREWIWNRSAAYAVKCYNDLHQFAAAYAGAGNTHLRDELDAACEALQVLKVRIMNRVKAEREAAHG